MIIWLYMLFTCYVTGFACIKAISGNAKFEAQREISYLYAGIGAVTVYAQFFSIFWRVGLAANLVLLLVCFLCMIRYRREFLAKWHTIRLTMKPSQTAFVI